MNPVSPVFPHRPWTVRAYLLALVLGIALPLIALMAVALYGSARLDEKQATGVAMQLARIAAAETAHLVADTHSLLATLAERPRVRAFDARNCDEVLYQYVVAFPVYADLALFDGAGNAVCSAAHGSAAVFSGQPHANGGPGFYVTQPARSSAGAAWSVSFVQPVFDAQGQLHGQLVASLDLARYKPAATLGAEVSPGAVISVVNDTGVAIARSSDAQLIGQSLRGVQAVDIALREREGTARTQGPDGEVLSAYAPVEGVPWVALVSIPARDVLSDARQVAERSAAAIGFVLVLVALWAWRLARRIGVPIQDIAHAARVVAEGARETRASVAGPAEIREVAERFNAMLDRRDAAERSLRESNVTLALVQEASAGGIWDWDLTTGKVTYSRRFKELLSYADDDPHFARDFTFRECLHADDRNRVMAAIDRHLVEDVPFDEEFRLRDSGGVHRWFSGRGLALRNEAGRAVRFAGSINDITQRKRAEVELRESKERFELAVRGTADGIWDWDITHNSYYISPQYKLLLGYANNDLPSLRQSFLQHLHPDDVERITEAVNAHLEQHVPYDAEYRLRCRDGSYKWFRGRGQAVWDAQGRALRMAGSVSDITARKQAESALRESEAKYRLLLETSTDAVLMVDSDSRILFASRALTDVLGYDAWAVIGQELELLQPERLRGAHRAGMQRYLVSGEKRIDWQRMETLGLHRDGSEVPVEISFSELQIEGRRIFAGFLRDISARRKAEAELRHSERLFREIADSSPAFIWMADQEGACSYVNRPWLEFTGRTLREEAGAGRLSGVHADDVAHLRRVYTEEYAARRPFRVEYRMRRRDGEYRWLLDQGVPRYDEQGGFIGYLGSCVDITDRVEANERIHRLSDMYAALSQVNDAIARARNQQRLFERVCQIMARFGSFVSVWIAVIDDDRGNLRTAACGGVTFGGLDQLVMPLPGETAARNPVVSAVLDNRHEIRNRLRGESGDFPLLTPEAARRVRAAAAFPLRRSGQVIGAFVAYAEQDEFFDREITHLLLDLANNLSFALDNLAAETRRQEAEEEIRELNATLEQRVHERTLSLEAANRELEAFSYSVSHDLRAPLRGISGFSDILIEKYATGLDDEGRHYLSRVKNASLRMARLINDMLALARIARTEIKRRPLNLTQLAEEVIAELRQQEPQRVAEVVVAPGLAANADPVLMRSVLENLLGNAWKFTGKRERARIEVGAAERAGQQVYFVRDNGAGFNMAYAEKLFAPFQRLHSEQEFTGTGVGLATVQRIVHRHNGHIWCESTEGEGACFYFTLAT